MRERKRMACRLEIKSIDAEGRFAGYASVFNVLDSQKDIILRGAFANTIQGRVREIKLLWQHQTDEPIGVLDDMFEDSRGLYVEGRLLLNIARAREALALLKSGVVKGLSIGYSPVRYAIDPETGIRKLAEVELWEISLVTFPANIEAGVTVVKSADCLAETKAQLDAHVEEVEAFVEDVATRRHTTLSESLRRDTEVARLKLESMRQLSDLAMRELLAETKLARDVLGRPE